jgi:hypothetical protein
MPQIVPAALGLKPKDAIDFLREKVAVTSEHWTDVWKQAHARSFMVAGASSQALVDDLHAEVIRAIDKGTTLRDFRKQFDAIVAKHGWVHNGSAAWRAQIIYETNLSTAYSAGRYAQMTAPGTLEVFPYWQYVHSGSRHPRLQHLAWNGLTLRADDPWWNTHYPPNGWRCGCHVRPMMRRELARLGKDGPDTAPPIETRPWVNKHTGETHQVPVGIDPGFDYNVGKAWQGPVPHDTSVLKPGGDAFEPAPQKSGARTAGGRAPGLASPVTAPAPAPAPSPGAAQQDRPRKPPVHQPGMTYGDWVQKVSEAKRPDGTVWSIGRLPDLVVRTIPKDAPRSILINAAQLAHMVRDTKSNALPLAELLALPQLLAQPQAILRDDRDQNGDLIFVFPVPNDPQGRLAKVIVAVGRLHMKIDDKRPLVNTVRSAGLVPRSELGRPNYKLLQGHL